MAALQRLGSARGLVCRSVSGLQARGAASAAQDQQRYTPTRKDRKYVRLAGMSGFTGRDDIIHFMRRNGVDVSPFDDAAKRGLGVHSRDTLHSLGDRPKLGNSKSSGSGDTTEAGAADMSTVAGESVETVTGEAGEVVTETAETTVDEPVAESTGGEPVAEAKAESSSVAGDEADDAVGGLQEEESALKVPLLGQGLRDVFENTSIWVYDAGSSEAARVVASKLHGKICGLKLTRASPVDERIARELVGRLDGDSIEPRDRPKEKRGRWRMHLIAPDTDERDRTLLLTGLPYLLPPRHIWAFFGTYDVVSVRLLRKSQVASVLFSTVADAKRAHRERANLPMNIHERMSIQEHS